MKIINTLRWKIATLRGYVDYHRGKSLRNPPYACLRDKLPWYNGWTTAQCKVVGKRVRDRLKRERDQ